MRKKVFLFCKDPGGTAGIVPVFHALQREPGMTVHLFANGAAVQLLSKAGEQFTAVERNAQALSRYGIPDILITSMCSDGGVGRDLFPVVGGIARTVCLQDYWGGQLSLAFAKRVFWPDVICVNDRIGEAGVRKAWPTFDPKNIVQTGYPALDRYAGYDVDEVGMTGRALLGAHGHWPIVLFAGQLRHSAHALAELVACLNDIGEPVFLVAREHRLMRENAPEEMPTWEMALGGFKSGTVIDPTRADVQQSIAATTVVVSMYSTMLIEAAALRKQNISLLYPDYGMAEFLESTGGVYDEAPLASLGCSAKAANRTGLRQLLEAALTGHGLGLTAAQEKYFQLDGNNARRVVDAILRES